MQRAIPPRPRARWPPAKRLNAAERAMRRACGRPRCAACRRWVRAPGAGARTQEAGECKRRDDRGDRTYHPIIGKLRLRELIARAAARAIAAGPLRKARWAWGLRPSAPSHASQASAPLVCSFARAAGQRDLRLLGGRVNRTSDPGTAKRGTTGPRLTGAVGRRAAPPTPANKPPPPCREPRSAQARREWSKRARYPASTP